MVKLGTLLSVAKEYDFYAIAPLQQEMEARRAAEKKQEEYEERMKQLQAKMEEAERGKGQDFVTRMQEKIMIELASAQSTIAQQQAMIEELQRAKNELMKKEHELDEMRARLTV